MQILFDEAVKAVAKGQVAVAYNGERVLGGGPISDVLPLEPAVAADGENWQESRETRGV